MYYKETELPPDMERNRPHKSAPYKYVKSYIFYSTNKNNGEFKYHLDLQHMPVDYLLLKENISSNWELMIQAF